jgi:hypothetical protein
MEIRYIQRIKKTIFPLLIFLLASCDVNSGSSAGKGPRSKNSTLADDIPKASDWLVSYFKNENINLDYSLNSIKYIDDFFEENSENGSPKNKSKLSDSLGYKMFAISSYIGQVIIKAIPESKWITDDSDPDGEINMEVTTKNGGHLWPGQKVMKRLTNGAEDGLYAYAYMIVNYK